MIQQSATRGNPMPKATQSVRITVGTAVFLALYGLPNVPWAQAPASLQTELVPALEEVTVTANRREQKLEAVPYNMSVVSSDALNQANITDVASLSSTVPGLSMFDYGARFT